MIGGGLDDLAMWCRDVSVSQGSLGPPVALLGLLLHSLARFLLEIVDVVLCHQHLDAMNELLGRARVTGKKKGFFPEMDLDIEFVGRAPVFEVAIKPIGLLHQQAAGIWVPAEIFQHLAETGTSTLSCRLDVDIFLEDGDAVRRGVFTPQFELSGIEKPSFSCSLEEMRA